MPSILIIKTSSLGDVIHNLPVVTDICKHVPEARIDWVVEEGFVDIPALHPRVDRVIPVATRRWRGALFKPSTWREFGKFRRKLRARDYDAVLDTQGLIKSALLSVLAKGPSYGQDRKSAREPPAAWCYRHTYTVARGRHAVVRNRDLAAQALGYPQPATPPDYGIEPPDEPLPADFPKDYVVCLHGSSRASKLWPDEHWIALVAEMSRYDLVSVLPWGNSAEENRAWRIAKTADKAIVLPRLRLRHLTVVLGRARAVVGVDTGLVHLAAALARPTVALYTDSSPELTGVFPADPARAVNLGGPGKAPLPQDVWGALSRLQVL